MKVFYAVGLIIIGVFGFWAILPSQQEKSAEIANIEGFIPAIMREAAIPGMAVSRIKDGRLVFQQVYGMADVEAGKAVTLDTPFNIASISKPIMGVTLLQLVDDGKLELDRDINAYLPFKVDNPHTKDEKITLRNLASHSAGIADYYDEATYSENRDPELSLEQHLRSLLTDDGSLYNNGEHYLKTIPGESRRYSNLSAGLAGFLVESVTGQTFADYSKDTLFHSLEMESASWKLNGMDLDSIAVPYKVEQCVPFVGLCADSESSKINYLVGKYINPPFEYKKFHPYPHSGNPQYPDGGVRVSIVDLSDFLLAVLHNRNKSGAKLLSDAMYQEMFRLQLPKSVSDSQRFFWRDRNGLVGHMGSDLGVFTALYFDPNRKDGFIILMNRDVDSKSAGAMRRIAKRLMQI
ncbi:serine hydrolase domain-containing protein [Microbulbifer variabilis]|uniref:serine hydrolase domain-containing protein n=1 Tax=Microbulbifer variabilis TaxID=266805 RepID=UPI001CFD2946|nr:serine hydrolase [Microbulbifer variabilis]